MLLLENTYNCHVSSSTELLFVCHSRAQLETDLKIEKEWRQTLQEDLQKEKDALSHLRNETQQIISLKKVNGGKTFKNYILMKVIYKQNQIIIYIYTKETI